MIAALAFAALSLLAPPSWQQAQDAREDALRERARVLSVEIDESVRAGRAGEAVRALRELDAVYTALGDPLAAAATLGRIGECHLADNCLPEAAAAFEARLARLRQILGEGDHQALARALNDLGFALQRAGEPARALALFEEALDMRRRVHHEDSADVAIALSNLAFCLSALGRSEEALPRYEEALAMTLRVHGAESAAAAQVSSNLGACLQALGRGREALPRFEEALAVLSRLRPGDDPDVARALGNLASALDAGGRPGDALPLHRRALEMRRRLHEADHPELVHSLGNLASSLDALGRGAEALPHFQEALAIARRFYAGDHPQVASSLENVGGALLRLRREAEALAPLEAALSMWRRMQPGDHPSLAASLGGVAACLLALGEAEEALPLLEEALAMRRRLAHGDDSQVAQSLAQLARALRALGRADEALARLEAALAMRRRLFPGDSPEVAQSLNDYASCLDALGAGEEALPAYEAALAMWRRLSTDGSPHALSALVGAAGCLQCLGRGTEALATYGEALTVLRREGADGSHRFASDLARLLVDDLGRPADALHVLDEAIGEIEHLRAGESAADRRERRGAARVAARGGAFDTMVRAQVALGEDAEALSYAERARVLGLYELLLGPTADPLEEVERAARRRGDAALVETAGELRRELEASERELTRLVRERLVAVGRAAEGAGADERAEIERLDLELGIARACESDGLWRRAALLERALGWSAPAAPAELQRLLEPDELLLYYASSDEVSFVFVVPPEGRPVRSHALVWPDGRPLRRAELERAVDEYLRSLEMSAMLAQAFGKGGGVRTEGGRRARHAERGHELFRALVPGEVWEAARAAKRARVVPAGAMQRLPLEALVVAPGRRLADSSFWLDEGPALSYVPAGSVLAWCRERARAQRGRRDGALVAVGDPPLAGGARAPATASEAALAARGFALASELSEPPASWLAPLAGARGEVEALRIVARLASAPFRALLGEDAREARLEELAAAPRYLHLALPAVSYDSTSGASALALARANAGSGAEGNGFLTAGEIAARWQGALADCELVVLSGMRVEFSATGEDDALFALPAAFLSAGAPAVIARLWSAGELADAESSALWSELYRPLLGAATVSGDARPEILSAFTAARRAFKRSSPEPHAWAAFVAIGDPR